MDDQFKTVKRIGDRLGPARVEALGTRPPSGETLAAKKRLSDLLS